MRKFYLLFICALSVTIHGYSQNIAESTIQWNSSSWLDFSTGDGFQEATIVTSSPTSIVWKYAGDSIKHSMTIRSTTGTWSNVANNGSIRFQADSDDDSAVVEFHKTSERIFIRIVIARPDAPLIYVVDVTNTEVQ